MQLRTLTARAADAYLWAQSWVVSGLHFAGIVKPNPAVKQDVVAAAAAGASGNTAAEAMSATAETARAAMTDPSVLKDAVEQVAENVAAVAKVSR